MTSKRIGAWTLVIAANVLAWGVLSFYGSTVAAQAGKQPFSNAVEQRNRMVRELQEIKVLLREQNALLRAQAARDEDDERSQR